MGLDTLIVLDSDDKYKKIKRKLGNKEFVIFTDDEGKIIWIRGKLYNDLIQSISGISLYKSPITKEETKIIYQNLSKTSFQVAKKYMYFVDEDETEREMKKIFNRVKLFFKLAIKYDCEILASW